MKLMIINGPNINMLGIREKNVYGNSSYDDLVNLIKNYCNQINIETVFIQSNYEGKLIESIHNAYFDSFDGIIINPAGYTHTSIALGDAISSISPIPVVEVHISNVKLREQFRHISYCKKYCIKQIQGLGYNGYLRAVDEIVKYYDK